MISRRLLRIKTLKLLYANAGAEEIQIEKIEKELNASVQASYDLYFYLFSSIIYVADYAEERIVIGLNKHMPSFEEAHPNKKFVENGMIKLIRANRPLAQYCKKHALSWGGDNASIIRDIYQHMIQSDYYQKYMAAETRGVFKEDAAFLEDFFKYEFEDNRSLEIMLEEKSMWWGTDELGYALGSIIRILDVLTPEDSADDPLSISNTPVDIDFAKRLLRHSLMHYFQYWNKAMLFVQNWEADRVAMLDIMLIVLGLSEAVEFPEIPIKVTINEYVEIAKYYSTPSSHVFVNGVLDRAIKQFTADGLIVKKGRGLVDSTASHKN